MICDSTGGGGPQWWWGLDSGLILVQAARLLLAGYRRHHARPALAALRWSRVVPRIRPLTKANLLKTDCNPRGSGSLTPPGLLFCRKPALTRKPALSTARVMEVLLPTRLKNKIIYV